MPPKAARRGGAAGRRGRGARAAPLKSAASAVKAEEQTSEVREELEEPVAPMILVESVSEKDTATAIMAVEHGENNNMEPAVENVSAQPAVENDNVVEDTEDDANELIEREEKGERLELEVEPDYENEDAAVDYDEREFEQDDVHDEEPDEGVEYGEEGDVLEEDETDMVEEELEEIGEDGEGEEYENVEEEEEVDVVDEDEHHEVVKEHRKRKEFEVFIGGLDRDATEDDLRKVFGVAGEITEVRLMMNPVTKKNKGFAFLRYATVEEAKRAVSELKDAAVRGRKCGVAPSHDNDTLFVGNICKSWTKEHLKDKLKSYGVENFDDLVLVEDKNNEGMNRGYALLEFSSRPEAMDAYRRLQRRDVVFGLDRSARVSFSDSYPEIDDEVMSQVKIVFIDGLPASWDEERVKKYLKKYGQIEKVELARNMPAAKRNDFGFVTFDTHDNAVACIEGLNSSELGEGDRKAKVRARLSRPLQRPRTRPTFRGNFRVGGSSSLASHRFGYTRAPPPRRLPPPRVPRPAISRLPLPRSRILRRPPGPRERPSLGISERARRLPPPERSYERRLPSPIYARSSARRDFGRRDELPPRRSADYVSRYPDERPDRRISYRDDYSPRGSAYSDLGPRSLSRALDRRSYNEDSFVGKIERSLPAYREARGRDYEPISGSKRAYADIDDVPHRYHDVNIRQTKARLDYEGGSSRYADTYSERFSRSHDRYVSSNPMSDQDSVYGRRHGASYSGSVSNSDTGGVYSSNMRSNYVSRGSDVGGGSYSSLYSSRSLGSSGYFGGSGSGSYY